MKINYYENNIKDYQNDLNNEIKILKLLSFNKNSIEYFGSYTTDNQLTLVLEKCDKNLKEFIKDRGCSLNVKEIKAKFKELNNLFKYMQKKEIIHRDLKLENLLVKYNNKEKTDYIIKVSDYGVSKFNVISKSSFSGFKGTIDTIAPEIILEKTKKYENSIDIFCLGIILYQISHNLKHPFGLCNNTMSALQFFDFIKKYKENYENDNIEIEFDKSIENKDFIDLVKKMIKLNPKNRLNWHDYFSHPFFK